MSPLGKNNKIIAVRITNNSNEPPVHSDHLRLCVLRGKISCCFGRVPVRSLCAMTA